MPVLNEYLSLTHFQLPSSEGDGNVSSTSVTTSAEVAADDRTVKEELEGKSSYMRQVTCLANEKFKISISKM